MRAAVLDGCVCCVFYNNVCVSLAMMVTLKERV